MSEILPNGVKLILHDDVQLIDWAETRTRGPTVTLRLSDPSLLDVFRGMDTATAKRSGHVLNLTLTEGDLAAPASEYGQAAKALRLSGFFRSPDVWTHVGTDAEFLEWLKRQPCAAARVDQVCHGDVVAAHVRRVADGAGTAIKPLYSAIPLCFAHHELQHAKGESAVGPKEWFDKMRIHYLSLWCWETLKADLGYESWSRVPPSVLFEWASARGVERYLPTGYRGHG